MVTTEATLTRRTIWTKSRNQSFYIERVRNWDAQKFKRNFRINRQHFGFCVWNLHLVLRGAVQLEQRYQLRREESLLYGGWEQALEYRSLSHLFGVGISTACVAVSDVCKAIVSHLTISYISIPSRECLKLVVDGFQSKWGMAQCVGPIDATHIPIMAPKGTPLDYYNRKSYHSVVMQTFVDHEYKFLDVYVGWPGSVHNARVLTNSGQRSISSQLPESHQSDQHPIIHYW